MAPKLIVICRFGGEFSRDANGSNKYVGGEAYAVDVEREMSFNSFLTRVATCCGLEQSMFSIKYYIPGSIDFTISLMNDNDMTNFLRFFENSISAEIYIIHQGGNGVTNRTSSFQPYDIDDSCDNLEHEPRMLLLWKDAITGDDQSFDGVEEFCNVLRKYVISHHFSYKFLKNEPDRVTAMCKGEGCQWRIHASRLSNTNVFRIKNYNKIHSCDPGINQKTHPQASKKLVGSLVQNKLRDTPKYRARDIVNDIRHDYGISLSYQQAYRGKEIACQEIHGSLEDSFNQIPWLCSKIMETNPGSYVEWETTEEDRFQRLFVSFQAQIVGFKSACRPLLFIDGTFGKDHYKVTILSAVAIDANNQFYPLAFSVVLGENIANWFWFLSHLKIMLEGIEQLTIIADRHVGLVDSVLEVFPNCYHAFCVHHLVANLMGSLSKTIKADAKEVIKGLVYAAAGATKVNVFNYFLDKIKKISNEAYVYLQGSDPYRWEEAYAQGSRYGHLTTNVAESFNAWILEARELLIILMIHKIREQLMELFYERREESREWTKTLTPSVDKMIQRQVLNSLTCQVSPSNNFLFEVNDGKRRSVNLETMTCSCTKWYTSKIPCIHVAKVCEETGRSIMPYCSPYVKTELWRLAYDKSINPVLDEDMPFNLNLDNDEATYEAFSKYNLHEGASSQNPVHPPRTRPRPGRPKRKRIESQPEPKRPLRCSRCHIEGHNRLTCNKAI